MIFQAGSLLLVIIGAYALKHVHIFGERDYRVVQGLVFNLTLPCAIILSFATNKHDMRMLWIVLFGFFACAVRCSSCISDRVATRRTTAPSKCSTPRD